MKNKILFLTIAAIGALLITASNGFSKGSYGDNMNDACAPASPFTGSNCILCHVDGGDRGEYTAAMDAYAAGGTTLTDYFCPTQPACNDDDNDGYGNPGGSSCANSGTDCNDSNPSINPGAVEICDDNIDNDCDGYTDQADSNPYNCSLDCTDSDNDGFSIEGVAASCGPEDCDDNNEFINPDIKEICDDNIDNDCDNKIDDEDSNCSADTCADYGTDRNRCKADPRCKYSGKLKDCFQPVVSGAQSQCEEDGRRWNKKKKSCR